MTSSQHSDPRTKPILDFLRARQKDEGADPLATAAANALDNLVEQVQALESALAELRDEKRGVEQQHEEVVARRDELWTRLLDMEGKYLDSVEQNERQATNIRALYRQRRDAELACEQTREENKRLVEQLEAAQAQLHAEQRDRNWWAANNSRERQRVADELLELKEAWTKLATGLIAVAPHLKQPYPDDDRWTPWSRFVGNEMDNVDAIVRKLTVTKPPSPPITEERPRDAGTSGATT